MEVVVKNRRDRYRLNHDIKANRWRMGCNDCRICQFRWQQLGADYKVCD